MVVQVQDSAALPLMIDVLVSPAFASSRWTRNLIWALSQIFRGGIQTLHIMVSLKLLHLCTNSYVSFFVIYYHLPYCNFPRQLASEIIKLLIDHEIRENEIFYLFSLYVQH